MEKIATKDVTEALARAMERADEMEHVVIIWETREEITSSSGGLIVNDECTLGKMNYLIDKAKKWIFD